jgi:hypothetical protein
MSERLDKFNNTFKDFITELVETFPDDMEFKMYHMGLQALLVTSPTTVIDVFQDQVVNMYETQIMNQNDAFFMEHDYSNLKESNGANAARIIDKVKTYYGSMKRSDQEVVMKYMRVLTILCKKYFTAV